MQIVYISNRIKILNSTLKSVRTFMPFIDHVVVAAPRLELNSIQCPEGIILTRLAEEDFPKLDKSIFQDAGSRNFYLKYFTILSNQVDEEFILSDDDYRPLKPIDLNIFKSNDRYNSYYYYDLKYWNKNKSPFDKCQQNSCKILKDVGLPTLGFAAHMPQIVNKRLYIESVQFFFEKKITHSLCEWSLYFNYAKYHYPQLFNNSVGHHTLCWPDYPNIWPRYTEVREYFFENFYPYLYNEGDMFEDLDELGTKENYEELLDLKIGKREKLRYSNSLPPMTYRKGKFRIIMPFLRLIYPLYFWLFRKKIIETKEAKLLKMSGEKITLTL